MWYHDQHVWYLLNHNTESGVPFIKSQTMDAEQYLFFLLKKLFHTVLWITEQILHSYWCCWQWQSQKADERGGTDVGQTGLGLGSNQPPWGKSLSIYGSVLGHNRRLPAHPERNRQIWVTRVLIQEPFRHQRHLARTETQTIHYLTDRGQCLLKLGLLTPSLLPLGHERTKQVFESVHDVHSCDDLL